MEIMLMFLELIGSIVLLAIFPIFLFFAFVVLHVFAMIFFVVIPLSVYRWFLLLRFLRNNKRGLKIIVEEQTSNSKKDGGSSYSDFKIY